MANKNGADDAMPPVMTVFAGLPGAGKTTVIDKVKDEMEFPRHLIIDLPEQRDEADDAVQRAITLNHSIAVESRFDHPLVLAWMDKAAERHFSVELVIIGVDDDDDLLLARQHARRQSKRQMEEAVRRMSAGA